MVGKEAELLGNRPNCYLHVGLYGKSNCSSYRNQTPELNASNLISVKRTESRNAELVSSLSITRKSNSHIMQFVSKVHCSGQCPSSAGHATHTYIQCKYFYYVHVAFNCQFGLELSN